MRWSWKVGIACVSILFLLTCLMLLPLSVTSAHEATSGAATSTAVTAQTTPTEDATVTALNKEKLEQEVQQLKNQSEPDFFGWLQMNGTLLSTLLVVIGGLIGLWRWFADRQNEGEKRAEERFQAVVTGLGDEREGPRIGAAILLRTFLRPGYEQFYTQTFDLAVAHLRLPRIAQPPEDTDVLSHTPENLNTPLPLTTLSQALIVAFKEAFPLARKHHRIFIVNPPPDSHIPLSLTTRIKDRMIGPFRKVFSFARKQRLRKFQSLDFRQLLDAAGIVLDNAYLEGADLQEAYIPKASLRKASLTMTNLYWANLGGADLSGADLTLADLRSANLEGANLSGARLAGTKLNEADLGKANLSGADLSGADLTDADLYKANLSGANLSEIKGPFASINGAILRGVKGLTKEELEACKAARAIVDEDSNANSSQPTTAPSPPPSGDEQTSSTPLAQGSLPTSDTDGSSAIPSQQKPGS